ncbi:MAG: UDP-N-acetylmuramoyl-L-alanyl-D-glutamate--2,6-diaminopimelate ligase, partial [Ruminococcaceae bacterium]|nr:UDP-N-acetylmuramoyl-L-alanyl-D-glutamate--2,6-diaminopimelate ligase [Oscillospiraceae bacterium]
RLALSDIAKVFYDNAADRLKIIGITGTKGKTTTAILIAAILNGAGIKCAYIGSNGIVIGGRHYETVNTTPESLELHKYFKIMEDEGTTHVVMEVSSQALMHYRVRGLSFEAIAYTNLSPDHIGTGEHASFEEYRDAKRLLFTEYDSKYAIVNADDGYSVYMTESYRGTTITYGLRTPSHFTGSGITTFRNETALGIDFMCTHNGEITPIRLRTPGDFSAYNGLCAIAVSSVMGVSPERAASVLRTASITGRFEIVDAIHGVTFLIDYAHNGLSLTSALRFLREYDPARLICVFGSVGGRTQNRREELAHAASALADYSIITSDNPDREDPEAIIRDIMEHFDRAKPHEIIVDRTDAVKKAVRMAKEGDIVLFAGKGHETYQLINGKKVPFSERDLILTEADAIKEGLITTHAE